MQQSNYSGSCVPHSLAQFISRVYYPVLPFASVLRQCTTPVCLSPVYYPMAVCPSPGLLMVPVLVWSRWAPTQQQFLLPQQQFVVPQQQPLPSQQQFALAQHQDDRNAFALCPMLAVGERPVSPETQVPLLPEGLADIPTSHLVPLLEEYALASGLQVGSMALTRRVDATIANTNGGAFPVWARCDPHLPPRCLLPTGRYSLTPRSLLPTDSFSRCCVLVQGPDKC